jgi:hypothetical protein
VLQAAVGELDARGEAPREGQWLEEAEGGSDLAIGGFGRKCRQGGQTSCNCGEQTRVRRSKERHVGCCWALCSVVECCEEQREVEVKFGLLCSVVNQR